ncbi:MAG: hypothetical protein ABR524_02430 [Thermoanaerobaculia bacterium]
MHLTSRLAATAVALLLLSACATNNSKVNLIAPEFRIMQITNVGEAARHVTGGLSVGFHAEILNRSSETLTLRRIQLESMGEGAYYLPSTTRPFDLPVPPDQVAAVEMWVSANIQSATILGANGPVTIRAKVEFDSAEGMFQKIYVQQVNAGKPRPFND